MGVEFTRPTINSTNATIAKRYTFNASTGQIEVLGDIVNAFLYIINTETNTFIYDASNPSLTGTQNSNKIEVSFDTSAMLNTDNLLIVFDAVIADFKEQLLNNLLSQQVLTNELLKEIIAR